MSGTTTGDVWDNHGGIVPTSAVDDCNVDSRFCGNDEIRGVGCLGQPRGDCPYECGQVQMFGTTTGGCPYDCGQVQLRLIFSAVEMVIGARVMKKTTMADRNQI